MDKKRKHRGSGVPENVKLTPPRKKRPMPCPGCGKMIDAHDTICPHCGADTDAMLRPWMDAAKLALMLGFVLLLGIIQRAELWFYGVWGGLALSALVAWWWRNYHT